jgi:hypothetical protein
MATVIVLGVQVLKKINVVQNQKKYSIDSKGSLL